MDPRALAAELNALLANENACLARHLVEAKPYVNAQTFRLWRDIEKMERDSVQHAHRLVTLITKIGAEVRPLPFEQSVADLHYIDIPTLLPRLIAEKKRQIATYDTALAMAASAVATELGSLRAACAAHLAVLEAAAAKLGVPA